MIPLIKTTKAAGNYGVDMRYGGQMVKCDCIFNNELLVEAVPFTLV